MSRKVIRQLSKEFQIKVVEDVGRSDDACIDRVWDLLKSISESGRQDFRLLGEKPVPWVRHGERFDTDRTAGVLLANRISLATEKRRDEGGGRTKLKCKLHNLVPELLYPSARRALCYPAKGPYRRRGDVKARFKLEQDVHFTNTKYCATGYLTIPGAGHRFDTLADFFPYFPNLARVAGLSPDLRLERVKDWQETVWDDFRFCVGGRNLRGALVTRRVTGSGSWEESELAFKVRQPKARSRWLRPGRGWDRRSLAALAALYDELYGHAEVFIQRPPIFLFANPVSSLDI